MNSTAPRRARAAFVPVALCVAALATLGFPGCPENVTGPGSSDALTMSNCWPNDDGRYWQYASASQMLESEAFAYLPPNAQVPEVTLADARALLAQPVVAVPGSLDEYDFRLQFDGSMTTQSGVTAQRLVESFPGGPVAAGAAGDAALAERFLGRLAAARPDLRTRIARLAPAAAEGRPLHWAPYLIHGYAWSKVPAWIGTYGDVDTLLAWKFLESMVRPGHTFRQRLVPSLASDVWLNASVERQVSVQAPGGGTVANAIEVLYLLDFGVGAAVDAMGNVTGLFRTFDYGTVVYAPGVGPVSVVERRFAYRGQATTHGLYLLEMNLGSTGVVAPGLLAGARGPR